MGVYDCEYADIEANVWDGTSEWGVVRYEWVPLTAVSHERLNKMYYDPDGGPSDYEQCTQLLVMDQIAGYNGDEPERSIVIVACADDGSSPNDTPLTECFVGSEGTTTIDELYELELANARGDKFWG